MRMKAIVLACFASSAAQAALVVSSANTANVECTAGVCTATATDAVLNSGALRDRLAEGDLTLRSGAVAGDIVVAVGRLNLKSTHALTLDSWGNIDFAGRVQTKLGGGVTLITRDGGPEGNLTFTGDGRLNLVGNAKLFINGKRFVLADRIAELSAAVKADAEATIALSRDIDASQEGGFTRSPVGDFNGTLDGLGHTISNLAIVSKVPADAGLFHALGAKASVRNLHLAAVSVFYKNRHSQDFSVAALAGANAGNIRNVDLTGAAIAIGGAQLPPVPLGCAAGIVGRNSGVINGVRVLGAQIDVRGRAAAGLVCDNLGTIVSSGANALVSSFTNGSAGGLVTNNGATGRISLSWTTGGVTAAGAEGGEGSSYAGGLVADNAGTIERSWAGSGVGAGRRDTDQDASFARAGTFAGLNSATISNSYASGGIGTENSAKGAGFVYANLFDAAAVVDHSYTLAWFMCRHACTREPFVSSEYDCPHGTANYWDTTLFDGPGRECPGLTGLTTSELTAKIPDGFDHAIWAHNPHINHGYPYLRDNPPRF